MPPKEPAAKPRSATRPPLSWNDRMKRWTIIWPKELIEEVKREAHRSGRTHSRVVADAVRNGLKR